MAQVNAVLSLFNPFAALRFENQRFFD